MRVRRAGPLLHDYRSQLVGEGVGGGRAVWSGDVAVSPRATSAVVGRWTRLRQRRTEVPRCEVPVTRGDPL